MKNEGVAKVITIPPEKVVNLCTKRRKHIKHSNFNRKISGSPLFVKNSNTVH